MTTRNLDTTFDMDTSKRSIYTGDAPIDTPMPSALGMAIRDTTRKFAEFFVVLAIMVGIIAMNGYEIHAAGFLPGGIVVMAMIVYFFTTLGEYRQQK